MPGEAGRIPDHRRSFARVDLAAIARNVAILREHIPEGVLLGAAIKADGYGHGAVPVARAALAGGASWLLVATVPEGLALRRAGLAPVRILVLGAVAAEETDDLVRGDLTPMIDAGSPCAAIAVAAVHHGRAPYSVHVKVDTGMHRYGVAADDAVRFIRALSAERGLRIEGLATHFATADVPDDSFLGEQAERFDTLVRTLERDGLRPSIVHAANSGAAIRRVGCWDMVRVGIAMYGIPPGPDLALPNRMRPAMSVRSRVARVLDLGPGASVGYGRTFIAEAPGRAALIPLGYADGLPRSLSNRGAVLIAGRRCPLIGNISMDQCVAALPDDAAVAVDDPAVIVGTQGEATQTMGALAADAGTIAYEVAVRFGARLRREYVGEYENVPL